MSTKWERRFTESLSWTYVGAELKEDNLLGGFVVNLMPICRPEWREDKLRRRTFEIGTSNILVGFYQEDENQDMVLVRINGNELVNRDQELLALLTMHKVGLSPPIYCQFGNGLCYGFVPGRVVELEELYQLEMSCRIARALGRLHSISIPSLGKQATAFQMIDRLLQKIPQDRTQTHQFHRLYGPWEQLKSEVGIVKVELSKLQSTMVFCHNDPQHNNIIYNAKMGTVTFIDFEYAGMNWRAFDLAAYFGEFPGLAYESCRYPSEKFQKMFIRTYLEEVAEQGGLQQEHPVSDEAVHHMYRETNKAVLAVHLIWTLWSIVMAQTSSNTDFDYLEYGSKRYTEYRNKKQLFLAL